MIMSFTRLSLPFSLLILFSLLVIGAFAADYGYDGIPADSPQAKPVYNSKPNGEEKPNNGEKPSAYSKPGGEEKPKYGSKPEGEEEKPNYGTIKPDIYKPKPEVKTGKPKGEEKPNYGTNQYNYKPKEEEKEKPTYENNPYVVKSKSEGEEKPEYLKKPEGDKKPNYGTNQYYNYKPKEEEKEKPDYEKKSYVSKPKPEKEEKPYTIAVEGFVYCKTGPSHYPIPGALAKVICQAVDEVGVVKTVPVCSVATDAKGYFYATVSSSINESNLKLKDCKALLENSPEKACNVPTDVNKGITGFPLSGDYRVLHDKHTNLYSAQPFFFTSDDQPKSAVPNGY